jgi:hypothetical protein
MSNMTSSRINNAELTATGRLAKAFVWLWYTIMTETNGAETKRLWFKFDGMTAAANCLGYGHTMTAVDLAVRDVMRKRAMPLYRAAGDQSERDTWEYECVTELTAELDKIYG